MTMAGWVMLILSVGGSTAFLAFCIVRVLSNPQRAAHMHSQVDIPPGDLDRD